MYMYVHNKHTHLKIYKCESNGETIFFSIGYYRCLTGVLDVFNNDIKQMF